MNKHSPGPYSIKGPFLNTNTISILAPEKEDGWSVVLAEICVKNTPDANANARLFAAAPELLGALKDVVALSDRNHSAWIKAHAAIAKAEGPNG